MTKQDYQLYIDSEHWKQLKQEFEENNTFCVGCGEPASAKDLDIHHRDYSRLWSEKIEDLVRLCRPCHYSVHLFYKTLVNDYYTGQLPFKPTLTEVTDNLLKNPTLFTLVWRAWIEKNKEENDGWIRLNNFHQQKNTQL